MKYLSTRNDKLKKTFTDVLFQGLSNDGGLFLPSYWPIINIEDLHNISYEELAFKIFKPYIGEEISEKNLYNIISATYKNFSHPSIAPLVKIDDNKFILELFYGPTLAFKDYAMQFLGNIFSYMMLEKNKKITILGATSGDTGSAAINAFKGKKDVNIFILHPYNKVSEVQRKQMTTVLEDNVFNIAVKGSFDDCQKIVKDLFLDKEIQKKTSLTAINSINWTRLMAQIVYYFWAFLQTKEDNVSFIVPSGNFGNVFSAHVAQKMGLPIKELHIATNINDSLHKIIKYGQMKSHNVLETYSPSMDIQISSNFERQIFESVNKNSLRVIEIMEKFKLNKNYQFEKEVFEDFQKIYKSTSVSNSKTIETINKYKNDYNYLSDPHTAVGLSILKKTKTDHPLISLACAHPSKFSIAVEKATGESPSYPKELNNIFDKKEKMIILNNSSKKIKDQILKNL